MLRRLLVTFLFAAALVAGLPAAAGAAAPVVSGEVDVQLWPGAEPGQLLVIVGITLPETTKLPATVRLPVPKGMKLGWAGEIATSTAAQDIQAKPVTKKGVGGSYVEFEMTKYPIAQAEFTGLALKVSGEDVKTEVEFVQTAPASLTGFAVRLPATASKVKIKPAPSGEPNRNSQTGELMYTLPSKQLKEGGAQTVELKYSTALPDTGGPSSTTIALGVLGGLVVLALLALAVVVMRQRRTATVDVE